MSFAGAQVTVFREVAKLTLITTSGKYAHTRTFNGAVSRYGANVLAELFVKEVRE